jgi:hypothetical protein
MPRSPIKWSRGTRTSSKKTALVRMFDHVQRPWTVMPGVSMGTITMEMPLCFGASGSVRTATQLWLAVCAPVFHIFWPLITHSSPSSTARV